MSNAQDSDVLVVGGMASKGEGERLQFVLPSFPISFNKLYEIDHNRRLVRLTDQAALWKTRTIPFVKPCRWPDTWLLKLTLLYESPNWLTKQRKVRRVDHLNFDKLAVDTLFAKWGWDDSRVIERISLKRYGPREQVQVTLERVELELGGG
jgi:hypothetical protein